MENVLAIRPKQQLQVHMHLTTPHIDKELTRLLYNVYFLIKVYREYKTLQLGL